MTDAFDLCIPFVLKEEGGYCCLDGDPGGATCRGVTMATLAAWRGCAVTAKDVEHLTEDEATRIYRARYWKPVRGDELPPAVALVMLDSAVNSGPAQAIRWLQAAVGMSGAAIDGQLGPKTLAAVRSLDPQLVAHELCRLRLSMLRSLKTWSLFKGGWSSRIARLRTAVDQFR
jgi:lysozyme family protein